MRTTVRPCQGDIGDRWLREPGQPAIAAEVTCRCPELLYVVPYWHAEGQGGLLAWCNVGVAGRSGTRSAADSVVHGTAGAKPVMAVDSFLRIRGLVLGLAVPAAGRGRRAVHR
jgi:hypothetical protein